MPSRHLVLVAAIAFLAGAATPAQATGLVTPDGQIAPQPYHAWVDAAYVLPPPRPMGTPPRTRPTPGAPPPPPRPRPASQPERPRPAVATRRCPPARRS